MNVSITVKAEGENLFRSSILMMMILMMIIMYWEYDLNFEFFAGIFAIFGELSHFSLTGGTISINIDFWAGPVL